MQPRSRCGVAGFNRCGEWGVARCSRGGGLGGLLEAAVTGWVGPLQPLWQMDAAAVIAGFCRCGVGLGTAAEG